MSIYSELSYAQQVELRKFAALAGRTWKSRLCELWMCGGDAYNPMLRQIRNKIGATGLLKIKSKELKAEPVPLETAKEKMLRDAAPQLVEALDRALETLCEVERAWLMGETRTVVENGISNLRDALAKVGL